MSDKILNSLEIKTTLSTEKGLNNSKDITIKENYSSARLIASASDDQSSTKCEDEEKMHKADFNKYNVAKGDERQIIVNDNEDNLSTENVRDLCFFTCFRKLFSLGKRNSGAKQISHYEDNNPVCKEALETFSALIDEKNLSCLIGKEFTLNTSVSIQSIDQAKGSEPNLIIQGSIPFMVETPEGLKKKKVRVTGRLYNPSSDINQSTGGGDSYSSTKVQQYENKLNLISVNTNFRPTLCVAEEIKWYKIEKYTQEEYQQSFYGCLISTNVSEQLKKLDGFIDPPITEKKESTEDIPVKSITVTRVKMRHLKFSDGSKCKQSCGKQQMTLKMPNGVYLKKKDGSSPGSEESPQESKSDEIASYYDPSTEDRRTENKNILHNSSTKNILCVEATKDAKRSKMKKKKKTTMPYDNAFTQAAYFCLKSYGTKYCESESMKSSPIFYNEGLTTRVSNNPLRSVIQKNLYSYPSVSKMPSRRFWPMTWFYSSFGETKLSQ